MVYKQQFTAEEWKTLEFSIIWMFQAIAGADKNIDKNELQALTTLKEKSHKFDCDIMRELIPSIHYDIDSISNYFAVDQRNIKTGLREIADIVDSNLSLDQSLLFKKSLLAIGMFIAYASGDVLSSKMSNEELQLLVELALFMKMSINDYRKTPTVEELMKKFME
ncbi:hypothetical protein D9V86_07015 [Bacteroidetes/Chlorobi group bacterium ChocPot_Mid]|jgi:hypothetical protein|nr:MAG: hypothetical protein D9V86_07015 [Bacteroidetes/Chlorobi group bacterium ChocPot_Mid]